jgi:hypothetical protein
MSEGPLRLNCKQAHRLLAEGMDRPLSWTQKTRLRLHLLACGACTNFEKHMAAIRGAMRRMDR